MKVRTDFVTNSSSSSFIFAAKDSFTDEQKKIIADFIIESCLMGSTVLKPGATEEEQEEFFERRYVNEKMQEQIKEALKNGQTIHYGKLDFEDGSTMWELAELYEGLFKALDKTEEFTGIDIDELGEY